MISTLRHLFTPHHTNNHRPRVLHPMGMVIMIALLLVTSSSVELLEEYHPQGIVLGYASSISVSDVFNQTNQQRIDNGLSPLTMSEKLNQAAAAKAADMFTADYWAHISPTGVPPWTFIKNSGYTYTVAGENLARDFDSTGPMVDAWMDSPTHRANIVHNKYTETGIAVVNGNLQGVDTTLVVQMFGRPVQPAALAEENTPQAQISPDAVTEAAPGVNLEEEIVEETPVALPPEFEPESEFAFVPSGAEVLSETQATSLESNRPSFYISPLDLKKSAVLAVILLIMSVLVIDELIIRHRQTVRFVGRNMAHVSFLVLTLIIVWNVIQPGVIQ